MSLSSGMNPPRPQHISQGEYATGRDPEASITTILGSCIAACLYDPQAHCGGMNHFLLPESEGSTAPAASFGINAMELLINALIKSGAERPRLRAKIFGGARMIAGLSDVGAKNATFIQGFLQREGIPCDAMSLGGTQARRVQFWPQSGRARQKLLGEGHAVEIAAAPRTANDVELF